jgi:hypothetical protein
MAAQTIAPKRGLGFRFHRHMNLKLGIPHFVGSTAEDQMHMPLMFKQ